MLRAILIAGFLCASPAAFSQELTAQELIAARQQACMEDYEKYCKAVPPGGGRIIACLAKEADKLTPACKKAVTEAEAEKK
jgi:hypothetical protein